MKNRIPLLMIAILAAGCAARAQVSEHKLTVQGDAVVKVQILRGNVVVRGWSKTGTVLVRARSEKGTSQPKVQQNGNEITIGAASAHPAFYCGAESDNVTYELTLPAGSEVRTKIMSGNFTAERMSGKVDAKIINGNITLRLDDPVSVNADCVSGTIDCVLAGRFAREMNLKSIAGTINLVLLRGGDAKVNAESMTGTITLRPDLKNAKRVSAYGISRVTGTLGSGAGSISLFTVSGTVVVK